MVRLAKGNMNLRLLFGEEPHPLTPNLVRLGWLRAGIAYELASGESILPGPDGARPVIYGVTIAELVGHKLRRYLDPATALLHSLEEAEAHIERLRAEGIPAGNDYIEKALLPEERN